MTRDRGSATVLVLALAGLLVLVALLLAAVGAAAVTRHRAASTADLAALAAADVALQGADVACAAAARATARGHAELQACRLDGDVAEVTVALRSGGILGRLGAARAVARAGPPDPLGTARPARASGCRRRPDLPTPRRRRVRARQTSSARRAPA